MSDASRVAVLLATDVRLYRDGLPNAVGVDRGVRLVATAGDIEAAVRLATEHLPDIILLDIAMAGALAGVRALQRAAPDARIVAFAVAEVDHDVLACAEAGVAAYVSRDASIDELIDTVRRAACGEARCSPRIAATLFRRLADLSATRPPEASPLTGREIEIVDLIDKGLSNKQIAGRLHIEVATVKNHVHHILEKLKVARRGEAAARLRGIPRPGRQYMAPPTPLSEKPAI
jgi:DNA-binding NarL/FixJ family response regulator